MSRLPQIFKYQLHLPSGEVAVIDTVARSEQRGQQAVGVVDVAVEATQGVRGRADGEVHCGEFAFGVGADEASPISCFATLLWRDKSLVVATDAHPASARREGDTDIVGIHHSVLCVILSTDDTDDTVFFLTEYF